MAALTKPIRSFLFVPGNKDGWIEKSVASKADALILDLEDSVPPEQKVQARGMMGAIVAFARSGDPNHDGLPQWAPYDARRRPTMVFDRRCRVVDDHRAAGRIASAPLAAWPATRLLRRPLFRGVGGVDAP